MRAKSKGSNNLGWTNPENGKVEFSASAYQSIDDWARSERSISDVEES